MQVYEVLLIAVALSIDACAITIANCTACKNRISKKAEWSMPVAFAIFQGVMPLLGYLIGFLLKDVISTTSKFISAAIFLVLAIKIIVDAVKERFEKNQLVESCKVHDRVKLSLWVIVVQAIATSIDAFAVGVTFVDLTFPVTIAVLLIAAATFLLVSLALVFGKALGKSFGNYAEWVGAAILLALAIKSLIEAF